MKFDTESRHRTKAGGNVFLDLGFPPKEAKRLLACADAQIDVAVRLKQQLMDEIAEWMKEASVTQAVAAEVLHITRPRVFDVVNHYEPGVVGSNPAGRATFNDLAAKTKSSFLLWDRCGTTYPPVRADLTEFKHFAAETKSSFIVVGPCGICFCTSAFAVGDA